MTRYANAYADEREAHDITKRKLARSNERLEDIFSFIRERALENEFCEWILKRDLDQGQDTSKGHQQ
jgi:hypothetical protein